MSHPPAASFPEYSSFLPTASPPDEIPCRSDCALAFEPSLRHAPPVGVRKRLGCLVHRPCLCRSHAYAPSVTSPDTRLPHAPILPLPRPPHHPQVVSPPPPARAVILRGAIHAQLAHYSDAASPVAACVVIPRLRSRLRPLSWSSRRRGYVLSPHLCPTLVCASVLVSRHHPRRRCRSPRPPQWHSHSHAEITSDLPIASAPSNSLSRGASCYTYSPIHSAYSPCMPPHYQRMTYGISPAPVLRSRCAR
jgi:hypothetical protein